MFRERREDGNLEGDPGLSAVRMRLQICRQAKTRWWLYLLRFHAEPAFRYCRPQPDAGRTQADRRTIHGVPGSPAAKHHRGGFHGEAKAAKPGGPRHREAIHTIGIDGTNSGQSTSVSLQDRDLSR